ncbi:MAG TPA: hypothetical protein VIP49_00990 [Candidatus Udaeobacter sp.]
MDTIFAAIAATRMIQIHRYAARNSNAEDVTTSPAPAITANPGEGQEEGREDYVRESERHD